MRFTSLLCSPFLSSTSAPLLRPLGFLYYLCCSPTLGVSTPPPGFPLVVMGFVFCDWSCFGSYSSGCYSAFFSSFAAPLSSNPPFRQLRLLLSSPLFRFPHSPLLLPVSICVFPLAVSPAAPSRLPPYLFWLAMAPFAHPVLPLCFYGLQLWLLLALCGAAPVALFVTDFPGVVPLCSGFALPGASPLSSCLDFLRFLLFIHCFGFSGCVFSLSVPSSSFLLEVFFAPASVPPQPVYLSSFWVSLLHSVVILPRSNLRFPSRCGLPLGRVRFCCTLCFSRQAGFWWSFPFLSRLPFCSCASFASKVPLGTWSPLWVESSFLWCSVSFCCLVVF